MSLVGSLEDLGLGDILQIVHLAAKSGVLRLRNEGGEGQIVFRRGMIHEAYVKGGPTDLRELLASRRAVSERVLERAWLEAHHAGHSLAGLLVERELVTAEKIDELRRAQIESAVMTMFGWPSGEFSFEMRDVADEGAELALEDGMNPQFLALEGTRRADEVALEQGADEVAFEPPSDEVAADARSEFAPPDPTPPVGVELETELLSDEDEAAFGEEVPLVEPEPLVEARASKPESESTASPTQAPDAGPVAALADGREAKPAPVRAKPAPASARAVQRRAPVVVVDPSLPVLEWVKGALASHLPRVHVFQRPDLGIERIRQYLARAEIPLVMVATDVPPDPTTGAQDAFELVARLKRQAPTMTVLLVHDLGTEPQLARGNVRADGAVPRPDSSQLADARASDARAKAAARLLEEVDRQLTAPIPVKASSASGPSRELEAVRETSARIREGAGRGEVLAQVLAFAAERFARVALFGVREKQAFGLAQVGLARAGGPEDADLCELTLGVDEPAWFRAVVEQRRPHKAAPSDEGDHRLAVLLGNEIPPEAYVAPIVTDGSVVALLYADNLPSDEPLGDTGGLEVLLDAAGIALDRAVLERTLAEDAV